MARRPLFEIPREIVIRGKRWLVVRDHELGETKHEVQEKIFLRSHMGRMWPDEDKRPFRREIHLAHHEDLREEGSTFLHELMHACSTQAAIPLAQEEKFIQDIEAPLYDALGQLVWRRR